MDKMSCYFIVSVNIENVGSRVLYDEYTKKVKPIVESYGGTYLVRTENIVSLSSLWNPDRVIVIKFNTREELDKCFASEQYQSIKNLRVNSVDSRAIIVEGN
jgi:uncharacterized protein (DUF1330 family)